MLRPEDKKMHIETVEIKNNNNAKLEIIIDNPKAEQVALLLLTADLISSGHFRLGKITSRGFGVLRFTNYEAELLSIKDIAECKESTKLTEITSGYELLQKLYKKEDVSQDTPAC